MQFYLSPIYKNNLKKKIYMKKILLVATINSIEKLCLNFTLSQSLEPFIPIQQTWIKELYSFSANIFFTFTTIPNTTFKFYKVTSAQLPPLANRTTFLKKDVHLSMPLLKLYNFFNFFSLGYAILLNRLKDMIIFNF